MRPPWTTRLWNTARLAALGYRERRFPFRSPAEIDRAQTHRLRAMVNHAYRTVPFYREAMEERGLTPSDFRSAEDLALLPLIDSTTLRAQPERFISSATRRKPCVEMLSTGTSGSGQKAIRWTLDAMLLELAFGERDRAVLRKLLGKTRNYVRVSLFPPESSTYKISVLRRSHILVPSSAVQTHRVSPALPYDQIAETINRLKPHVVHSYGSYAEQFFRFIEDHRIPLTPPIVWVYGADMLSSEGRQRIESGYNCRIHSTYQCVEAGRIGFLCEAATGFHLNADLCPIRIVDERGIPVPEGTTGEIVISNLLNPATVVLNYRLGDRGALTSEPCACGRSLPRLERLEGRMSDVLHLADGSTLLDTVLIHVLKPHLSSVIRFRIVERGPGRFVMQIVPALNADPAQLLSDLSREAARILGPLDRFEVEIVSGFPAHPSGKLRRVIHE